MRRLLPAVVLLAFAAAAHGYIKVLTPLKQVLDAEKLIFIAEVTKTDPDKPSATLTFKEDLKGKCGFETLTVDLTGDGYAKKDDHTKALLKRLAAGRKLVLFTSLTGKEYVAFAFVEGTWFQLKGTVDADGKTVRWAFLHCEPYFRRTFKGTTAELKEVVEKYVAGKAPPPAPDEKEPPGFGPEAEKGKEGGERKPPNELARAERPATDLPPLPRFGDPGGGEGGGTDTASHSPLTPTLSPEAGERGLDARTVTQPSLVQTALPPLPRFGGEGGGEGAAASTTSDSPHATSVEPNRLRFFSPKGWQSLAQGNALGSERTPHQPEGLGQGALSQPFRLQPFLPPEPRALPWAKESQPVGLEGNTGRGNRSPLTRVPEAGERGLGARTDTLFAVIPSVVLVGPLAIVAAIFPGLFAKLAVQMRRWRAFLVAASTASTLSLIYFWVRTSLPDSVWFSPPRVALMLACVPLACSVWAGRRYRSLAVEDAAITAVPSKHELQSLVGVASLALGTVLAAAYFVGSTAVLDPAEPWKEFAATAAGLCVAAVYGLYRRLTVNDREGPVRLSVSGESAALAGFTAVALFAALPTTQPAIVFTGEVGDTIVTGPKLTDVTFFNVPDADDVMSGITHHAGRLYFGTLTTSGFRQAGAVFCLDAATGKVVWRFDAGGSLKPVFSTPAVANGRVYVGEGLHTDADRRLFCLDAATGESKWEKVTASHTEGSPHVVDGKVFFAAGDDGVFCVTADGKDVWHADGAAKKLHVDTPPAVNDGRVFYGSGYNTLAAAAADGNTGNELWRTPLNLRSFGPPLARAKAVYFGLGTGNLVEDLSAEPEDGVPAEKTAAGAVVALDAKTGHQLWRADLPKSVHTRLACDPARVYAACKDGTVYAFARADGKRAWSRRVGTSFMAGISFVNAGVYAVGGDGRAVCLDPVTGRVAWVRELAENGRAVAVMSNPTVVEAGATRTLFVGCKRTTAAGLPAAAVVRIIDTVED